MPTADPRRWQPRHVSYCSFTTQRTTTTLLLINLRIQSTSSACKMISPFALRHLNESSRTGTFLGHFPFLRRLYHSYLPFSSFPIGLSHLSTYTQRAPHLNLVYLYQPIVIGGAFMFVILLLLALPCLNSLTRCVITCRIRLNNPRQRGLEVFMNLSQPRFNPRAAAMLASSGFFFSLQIS